MALRSDFRWVVVGSLKIRPHQKSPPNSVRSYTVDDLACALRELTAKARNHRRYSNDTRVMWCTHVLSEKRYYTFLLNDANANAADVAFYNRDTEKHVTLTKNHPRVAYILRMSYCEESQTIRGDTLYLSRRFRAPIFHR